jgi:hypothetical protein
MSRTLHLLRKPERGAPNLAAIRREKVGREDADDLELRAYLCLDAAKRSRCPSEGYHYLATVITMAAYVGRRYGLAQLECDVMKAGLALNRAGLRHTRLLDLTTGEYKSLLPALRGYFALLPDLELGVLDDARRLAEAFQKATQTGKPI